MSKFSFGVTTYNLTTVLHFIATTTNYQDDCKRLLVLDFIAFLLAIFKYILWVSWDKNFLFHKIKILAPILQFDGNSNMLQVEGS